MLRLYGAEKSRLRSGVRTHDRFEEEATAFWRGDRAIRAASSVVDASVGLRLATKERSPIARAQRARETGLVYLWASGPRGPPRKPVDRRRPGWG